jgi:hypothetical protein
MSTEKTNKKVKMESATTPNSNESTTPQSVESTAETTPTAESDKKLGRPIDTMSKRQKVLLEKKIKEKQGITSKKGRPVSPDSKRQQTEAEKQAKREAGQLHPGRPKYTPEQKAEADKIKEAKKAEELKQIELLAQQMIESGTANEILAEVEGTENVTTNVTEEVNS